MPGTPSLRERKKQRTRRTIERAALDLFEKHGFDDITIDDIAAAAEIAPRTFFHYFPSKEDVVLADYTSRLDRIVTTLNDGPGADAPWHAIRRSFLDVAADYEAERPELLRRFRIISSTPSVAARSLHLQASWEEAVAVAVSHWLQVDVSESAEPRLLAGAALAAMRTSLARWLAEDGRRPLPDHVAQCFDLLEIGLGTIGTHMEADRP